MKNISKLLLLFIIITFVTNCGPTKGKSSVGVIKKPELVIEEDLYIPVPKSERKNYFKETSQETKWVDSIYTQMKKTNSAIRKRWAPLRKIPTSDGIFYINIYHQQQW